MLADFNPPPKRGRPSGETPVCTAVELCLDDIALMRALVQGVPLAQAATRYWIAHADLRVARTRARHITAHAISLVRGHDDGLARSLRHCLASALSERAAPVDSPDALPTLEQFAQSLDDPYAWSESDLLELYQDRYGEHPQAFALHALETKDARLSEAMRALTWIQSQDVRIPKLGDEVRAWFNASVVRRLEHLGIQRLEDLAFFVNRHGHKWFRRVPGLGQSRAQRLVQWMQDHEAHLVPVLSADLVAFESDLAVVGSGTPNSLLRTDGKNAMDANNDQDALQNWMVTLEFLSAHTKRAYSRDVARLLLWAGRERGKTLSDINVADAAAYVRFLQNPPAHWIATGLRRAGQRLLMRGPLSPTSTARVLAAVGHFYGFLVETNYLSSNPFSRVRVQRERGVQMDVQRFFSNAHLDAIRATLVSMPSSPAKTRLVALLALLESTGLRIGEVPTSWRSVVTQMDVQRGPVQCLRVMGKGGRERFMPIKAEVLEALAKHRDDQCVVGVSTVDLDRPLIGLIHEPIHADQMRPNGALSTSRMRTVLKGFFQTVAAQCESEDLADGLRCATPHFLRHTFAHRVLDETNQDLAVTQVLLGHQQISTTGVYVKAGMAQRMDALSGLSVRVLVE